MSERSCRVGPEDDASVRHQQSSRVLYTPSPSLSLPLPPSLSLPLPPSPSLSLPLPLPPSLSLPLPPSLPPSLSPPLPLSPSLCPPLPLPPSLSLPPSSLLLYGMLNCIGERYEEGSEFMELATSIDPTNITAWTMRGRFIHVIVM